MKYSHELFSHYYQLNINPIGTEVVQICPERGVVTNTLMTPDQKDSFVEMMEGHGWKLVEDK